MPGNIMGWDIGGAHLKAAIIQPPATVTAVFQRPCQLWKGIAKLDEAAKFILEALAFPINRHVLTMTGELVDCFADRNDGVKQILSTMSRILKTDEVLVYAGSEGLLRLSEIKPQNYLNIASANWLASATWAAQQIGSGLFVDIGSTTTDILLLHDGKVMTEAYTDYGRLQSQELVYTGIIRTAVMAVAQSVQDQGREIGLMAEYFATMADVYRLTGELNELHDQSESADGAEKTLVASANRLARMIGCDVVEQELTRWEKMAYKLRNQQQTRIQSACQQQLERIELPQDKSLIGAGVGRFLVKEIASNLGRAYLDYSDLFSIVVDQVGDHTAADCAAAVAVACLLAGEK